MKIKKKYTRNELIELCQASVVPCSKWRDRDSNSAQQNIQKIYRGLTGGVKYTYNIEGETIWIDFNPATDKQKAKMLYLDVDSLDTYLEWYESEYGEPFSGEMFESSSYTDWSESTSGYIPTIERLQKHEDEDWY